jgi:hypothetical protein
LPGRFAGLGVPEVACHSCCNFAAAQVPVAG